MRGVADPQIRQDTSVVEDAASNQSETSVAEPTAEPGPEPPLLSAAQPEVPAEPDQSGAPADLVVPPQAPRPARPETARPEAAFQTERTPTEPPAARRALSSDRAAPEPAVLSGALPDPAPFAARREAPGVSAAAMPDGLSGVVPGRSATTFAMSRPPVPSAPHAADASIPPSGAMGVERSTATARIEAPQQDARAEPPGQSVKPAPPIGIELDLGRTSTEAVAPAPNAVDPVAKPTQYDRPQVPESGLAPAPAAAGLRGTGAATRMAALELPSALSSFGAEASPPFRLDVAPAIPAGGRGTTLQQPGTISGIADAEIAQPVMATVMTSETRDGDPAASQTGLPHGAGKTAPDSAVTRRAGLSTSQLQPPMSVTAPTVDAIPDKQSALAGGGAASDGQLSLFESRWTPKNCGAKPALRQPPRIRASPRPLASGCHRSGSAPPRRVCEISWRLPNPGAKPSIRRGPDPATRPPSRPRGTGRWSPSCSCLTPTNSPRPTFPASLAIPDDPARDAGPDR